MIKEEILTEWNPWWRAYKYEKVERNLLKKVTPWIKRKEIVAIVGARRSGKTTLLFEIIAKLIADGIDKKNILFIKCDDERVKEQQLIDTVMQQYLQLINPSGKVYVFIDEIQEVDVWQKTLKRLYDLTDYKFFISGSNAGILKEELTSAIAGRFCYFEMYPFSFAEMLIAKGVSTKKFDVLANKNVTLHHLNEYLEYGGFPEVVLEKDRNMKQELLRYYLDSIIYRDVVRRAKIRNVKKLEDVVSFFLQNVSNYANFTKLAKHVGLTTDSVVEYAKRLEDAYLIFAVSIHAYSLKKQFINPKKMYCVDTGLRNLGFRFSEDAGRLAECVVFVELKRRGKEIYYWKNRHETDFTIKEGKRVTGAFQVCWDMNEETRPREVEGLKESMTEFKLKEGTILTRDYEAEEKIEGGRICFVPIWKWLLE